MAKIENPDAQTETPSVDAPVASAPTARKSSQVGTTVSAEYFDGLEDYRWTARKKMTEIVKEALDEYVAKNGIKVDGSAPKA